MKRKIAFLFFTIIGFCCWTLKAVGQAGTMDQVRNPQSPDAAALGKYVEVPVGHYNGIPNIGVPLYELDIKGLKVPVSLSYHAGGIKVQELPGSVGAGWSLNTGGVITRIVRGYPDYDGDTATKRKLVGWNFTDYEGWDVMLSTPGVETVGATATIYSSDPVHREVCNHNPTRMDAEIDQYYFNFLGHTGKFTFSNKGVPILLSEADLKIVYSSGVFTITDGQGVEYTFGALETQYDDPSHGPYYTSAWYLSKIYIPYSDQTVNFTYSSYDNMYSSLYPYWGNGNFYSAFYNPVYSIQYATKGYGGTGTGDSYGEIHNAYGYNRNSNPFGPGTTLFINEINYDSTKIKFFGGLTRTDMYKYKLDSMIVFSSSKPVKNVRFHYGYFNNDSTWNWKKLKLDSLKVDDQMYRFGYIESYNNKPLPVISSHSKDLWGYYNGWNLPDSFPNFKLLESKGYTPGHQLFNFSQVYVGTGMNKCPDYNYAQIGTLSSIQYPSGGKSFFEYEGNDFTQCSFTYDIETDSYTQFKFHPVWKLGSKIFKAGGLRIKKIRFEPNPGEGSVLEKTYSYRNAAKDSSTGVLESPIANISQSLKYGTPGWFVGDYGNYGWWHLEGFFMDLCAEPIIPLGNSKGGVIGYATVTETRQDSSKTVYHFTNGTQDDKWDDFVTTGVAGAGSRLRVRTDKSWLRGLPEQVDHYNSNNRLLKQDFTRYTYNADYTDSMSVSLFLTDVNIQVYFDLQGYNPLVYPCYQAGYTATQDAFIASNERLYKILDSSVVYSPSGNVSEFTRYGYHDINDTPVHNYPIVITTNNSKGEQIITNLKYPQDYTVASTATPNISKGVYNLLSRHVLSNPVEKYVQKKNANGTNLRTVSAEFTEYSPLSNPPFPKTGYRLVNSDGLTDFTPATISTSTATMDSRYQPSVNFTAYDSKGNLIEARKPNDAKQCYIWDYNGQYLVAAINNADTASIAYTSFESTGKGYWSYSGSTFSDAAAPTGKKCYSLSGGAISRVGLSSSKNYIVSYWSRNGSYTVSGSGTVITGKSSNGWTYYEHPVTGVTTISISGSGRIDELRLYPKSALMKTYTYTPLTGMNSQCDENNRILYYEYDTNNRLAIVRDQDKRILKTFCYNYQGQLENCAWFGNRADTSSFTKSNCTGDSLGNAVQYIIPANTYFASTQAEADSMAKWDKNANGQVYANSHGTCSRVWFNQYQYGYFTRNNCGSGYTGSTELYEVAANTYSSTTSQAAANALAVADVNANGQNYANTYGTCALSNITLYYNNSASYNHIFYYTFTNVETSQVYNFQANAYTYSGSLGSLPPGFYDIEIYSPSNYGDHYYAIGCYDSASGDTYAYAFYIYLDNSCNTITINY